MIFNEHTRRERFRPVQLFASTSARIKSDSTSDRLEWTIRIYVRTFVRPGQINFPRYMRACPAAAVPSSHGCSVWHDPPRNNREVVAPRPATHEPWTYRSVHQKCGRRAGQVKISLSIDEPPIHAPLSLLNNYRCIMKGTTIVNRNIM